MIRRAACGGFCIELDISNANPTIALYLAKKFGTCSNYPELERYIENKDRVWEEVAQHFRGIHNANVPDSDEIKNLFIRLLFGGSYRAWAEANGLSKWATPQCALAFEREMRKIYFIISSNPEYRLLVAAKDAFNKQIDIDAKKKKQPPNAKKTKKKSNASVLSVAIHAIEDTAIKIMEEVLHENGYHVISLIFDGLLVRPENQLGLGKCIIAPEVVKKCELAVSNHPDLKGLHIKLKCKDL